MKFASFASLFSKFFPQGGLILTVTAFGSYALGLVRDRIFAQRFGAGPELDAYNAAFLVPDFLLNFFIAGSLAAAFVPIFSGLLLKDKAYAARFAHSVISLSVSVMAFWGLVLLLFAPFVAPLVAPGFAKEQFSLLVALIQILALSPILFAASNAFGGILLTQKRFLSYGLAPILYNTGIIGGTLVLGPTLGIFGTAIGTVFGALLHMLIRFFELKKIGFSFKPSFSFAMPEIKTLIRLSIPKMFGHPLELLTFWGFTAIASTIGAGSVAILNFARNFQSVPVSLIGIAFATAAFPQLSEYAAKNLRTDFKKELLRMLRLILALTIPAALLMYLLREILIGVVLGGGAFGREAVAQTAGLLGAFTLSIPTESTSHLLARAFYATKNTAIPVAVSFLSLLVAIALGALFAPIFGTTALGFAFFAGSLVKIAVLSLLLPWRMRKISD